VSADDEGQKQTQDLELTSDDANLVKGGMLPIDGGGAGGASHIVHKKRRKRKKHQNSEIGPYKGKH
jgi:hypothetical protein